MSLPLQDWLKLIQNFDAVATATRLVEVEVVHTQSAFDAWW